MWTRVWIWDRVREYKSVCMDIWARKCEFMYVQVYVWGVHARHIQKFPFIPISNGIKCKFSALFFEKELFVLFALDAFFLRTINCKWMHVLQLNFKIAYLSLGAIGKLFFFSSSFSFSFAKLLVILIGNFSVARFKRNWMCSLA